MVITAEYIRSTRVYTNRNDVSVVGYADGQSLQREDTRTSALNERLIDPLPSPQILNHAEEVDPALKILAVALPWQEILCCYVRNLRQYELTPETIRELIPIPTCYHPRFATVLLMSYTSNPARIRLRVILARPVPHEE